MTSMARNMIEDEDFRGGRREDLGLAISAENWGDRDLELLGLGV